VSLSRCSPHLFPSLCVCLSVLSRFSIPPFCIDLCLYTAVARARVELDLRPLSGAQELPSLRFGKPRISYTYKNCHFLSLCIIYQSILSFSLSISCRHIRCIFNVCIRVSHQTWAHEKVRGRDARPRIVISFDLRGICQKMRWRKHFAGIRRTVRVSIQRQCWKASPMMGERKI
jgi:hypothetical protein